MAAPRSSAATSTVGGKGSSLSSDAVYAVSRGLSALQIDSAALEKLSQSSKKAPPPVPRDPNIDRTPRFLTPEESCAALAVVLNKLVLADPPVRPTLPALVEQTLALTIGLGHLDFSSSLGFLDSLCYLNGKNVEEIGVTSEEISILESSCIAASAICAIIDCCASALVRVLDAVAALSCEAARADTAAFDLLSSADGFAVKDETDVAADMKVLLFGSKLVGQVDSALFSEIPTVHGGFREDARLLHGRALVELNSAVKVKKKTVGGGNDAKERDLVKVL